MTTENYPDAVDAPWPAGAIVYREQGDDTFYGQLSWGSPWTLSSLDGQPMPFTSQNEAMRQGWLPMAKASSTTPIALPAKLVAHVASTVKRTTFELDRVRETAEQLRTEARNFRKKVRTAVTDAAHMQSAETQEQLYGLLSQMGFDVHLRHTVKVTLMVTVDVEPNRELDEATVIDAVESRDFDLHGFKTDGAEWIVED